MAENSNCHDVTRGPQLPDQAVQKKRHVCMTNQVGTWPNVKDIAITKTICWRDVTFIICLFALPQALQLGEGGRRGAVREVDPGCRIRTKAAGMVGNSRRRGSF